MAFAEGIAHLAQHRAQGAVGPVAKPERDRIEDVAKHTWKGEHLDRSNAASVDAACRQIGGDQHVDATFLEVLQRQAFAAAGVGQGLGLDLVFVDELGGLFVLAQLGEEALAA